MLINQQRAILIILGVLSMTVMGAKAQLSCASLHQDQAIRTNHQQVNFNTAGIAFLGETGASNHALPYTYGQAPLGTIHASAPWISAIDPLSTTGVMVMAPRYDARSEGYGQGPLNDNTGYPIASNCQEFNHIWTVPSWAIERLLVDYNDNSQIDGIVEVALLQWPGKGNPHFLAQMGYALPNQDLAPFYDRNNDGIYDPMQGDYPVYKMGIATAIAEQLQWTVFHSRDVTSFSNNGGAMGIEVQQTAYALDCGSNEVLNKALLVTHKVINKSQRDLVDLRYGNWTDFDLGCSSDDYLGTIPHQNTVYAYNADNNDNCASGGYGMNPPVQAVTFLNQTLNSAVYYTNSGTPVPTNLSLPQHYEHLLSGKFENGVSVTRGNMGYNPTDTMPVAFVFPDNPSITTGWSMATVAAPTEAYKIVAGLYKSTFLAGEVWEIDLAYSYHRGANNTNLQNVRLMEQQVNTLQGVYNNGLSMLSCPSTTICPINCIYPGDANNNGVANDFDILDMGLRYGLSTIGRTFKGNRWFPYPPTNSTLAYFDADGFGQVDSLDFVTNTQNWQKKHTIYTGAQEGSSMVGTDLYLERVLAAPFSTNPVVTTNDVIQVTPSLGTATNVFSLQGLTFRVAYDPTIFDLGVLPLDPNSHQGWMDDDGASVFHRATKEYGVVHYVTSRLDNGNYMGWGQLDALNLVVKPTAFTNTDTLYTQICFENYKAVQANGVTVPIGAECLTIAYANPNYNSIRALSQAPPITLYPNPANTVIQVDLGKAVAESITLLDVLGQSIQVHRGIQGAFTIQRGQLPKGMYLIQIVFENGSQSTHKVLFQ